MSSDNRGSYQPAPLQETHNSLSNIANNIGDHVTPDDIRRSSMSLNLTTISAKWIVSLLLVVHFIVDLVQTFWAIDFYKRMPKTEHNDLVEKP